MYIGRYTDKLLEENRQLKRKIEIYESDTVLSEMKDLCDRRVRAAADREKRNYDSWMKALEVNRDLKKRNTALWKEKEKYCCELKRLRKRNEQLEKFDMHRIQVIQDLEEGRDKQREENADQGKQIEALKEEICKLKAQIDHDGATNGIPTSRTPIGKKKVIPNTRNKSEQNKGGQPGHEKRTMRAFEKEEITDVEDHTLEACPHCGGELEKAGDQGRSGL